jgi:hypothetical protein
MSNSTRRFRRGGRPRRGVETPVLGTIPKDLVDRINTVGEEVIRHNKVGIMINDLAIKALGPDAEEMLVDYVESTGGEGHPDGLFAFVASRINEAAAQGESEDNSGLPLPPQLDLRVTFTPASWPDLPTDNAVINIPLTLDSDRTWNPTLRIADAGNAIPDALGWELIDRAMTLTLGLDEQLGTLRALWENGKKDPTTEWRTAPEEPRLTATKPYTDP